MILVYICERLIKLNFPKIFEQMQRKGINCQQFSTNPLITLFTWQYKRMGKNTLPFLDMIWDLIILRPNWITMLSIFLYIIGCLEDFILVCEMEDFLVFWDTLFSSEELWFLKPLHKENFITRVKPDKFAYVEGDQFINKLRLLKTGVETIRISDEIMDLLHQEYLSNHNNIVDVLGNINDLVTQGQDF
jgi:Rab-GTPase-TBC domain